MTQFSFDIQIRAVARVTAASEAEARAALDGALSGVVLPLCRCSGPNQVMLSDAILAHEPKEAKVIEDGVPVTTSATP